MKRLSPCKRQILVACLLLLTGFKNLQGQYVLIPDSNFAESLRRSGYGQCFNGNYMDTTCPAIINASVISLNIMPIRSIEGIEYFTNLDTLECNSFEIDTIPALPPKLMFLDCGSNKITSLPPLPRTLVNLRCEGSQLSVLPLLPASLQYLDVGGNDLTSLPSLPAGLQSMEVGGNNLTTLPSLPDSLTYFDFSNNAISSMPNMPPTLTVLDCGSNKLDSLLPLPLSLQRLYCNGNLLRYLPALPPTLETIYCGQNSLSFLPALPNSLYSLNCDDNVLTNISTLPQALLTFSCNGNHLTSLPTLPASLSSLDCGHNQLTELPNLPDTLFYFDCSSNPNLLCMPLLKHMTCLEDYEFDQGCISPPDYYLALYFDSTGITCLPNYPDIVGSLCSPPDVPLCAVNNANNCFTTSITETSDEPLFSIFPDPAKNDLFVLAPIYDGPSNYKILNSVGQVISDNVVPQTKFSIDLSSLASGLYIIEISNGQKSETQKFIKE